jgi:hypothetical protein
MPPDEEIVPAATEWLARFLFVTQAAFALALAYGLLIRSPFSAWAFMGSATMFTVAHRATRWKRARLVLAIATFAVFMVGASYWFSQRLHGR